MKINKTVGVYVVGTLGTHTYDTKLPWKYRLKILLFGELQVKVFTPKVKCTFENISEGNGEEDGK